MTTFTVGIAELGKAESSTFREFITLASGRSVISGADWGPERFELGLSGEGMVRVFWAPDGLHVNFITTTNEGEIPPLVVRLGDQEARLPARIVEARIRALRQLYSVVVLLLNSRGNELGELLVADVHADPEVLLAPEDWLHVEGIAPGSWYVTLWTSVQRNFSAIYSIALMVFGRGREAILGKLEAERRIKDLEADAKEFELLKQKLDYGLGLAEQVSDPELRRAINFQVEQSVSALLQPTTPVDEEQVKVRTHLLLGYEEPKGEEE